jgi:hypothetical protein
LSFFHNPVVAPEVEIALRRRHRREVGRQHAPGRTAAQNIRQSVDDRAVVKLEAYPFTRYGTLLFGARSDPGLTRRTPSSTRKRGLVFPVRVKLSRAHLTVDGSQALLSAGMSASVEIVTGKRRVIEFVWSPVAKTVSRRGESGERRSVSWLQQVERVYGSSHRHDIDLCLFGVGMWRGLKQGSKSC